MTLPTTMSADELADMDNPAARAVWAAVKAGVSYVVWEDKLVISAGTCSAVFRPGGVQCTAQCRIRNRMTLPTTITAAELANRENETARALWVAVKRNEAWQWFYGLSITA